MFTGSLIASEIVSRVCKISDPKLEFQGSRDGNDFQLILPNLDLSLDPLDKCGLKNRKGDEYSIGDLLLLLLLKKEDYTYSFVTSKGFKYINVLEREKIKNIVESSELVNTNLSSSIIKIKQLTVNDDINNKADKAQTFTFSMTIYDKLEHEFGPIDTKLLPVALSTNEIHPITRNSMLMSYKRGYESVLERAKILSQTNQTNDTIQKLQKKNMRLIDEIYFRYKKRPIIIVPSGINIVCKNNIKTLLEESKYLDPASLIAETTAHPMNAIELVHKIGGKQIRFRIIENSYISRMSQSDWVSIVCVIINPKGGRWQFKGYPFENIVNLFTTLKYLIDLFRGVLFVHDTDPIPDDFTHWDIKICRISRLHRHKDACVTNDFWQYLESFLLGPRKKHIHPTKTL
ncbi:conserved Plasmodium protein, unknown function [Babesia microti strain RI]|uniref:Cell division control protein 73 C-terminal domain-containing protein n=1 Tax=Babesia microti (strain RI) TaxID=1133968 RepID=A0A1N6LY70_BABMR|nr:conserved Plasmodium protein, unknown function [Babesia microti strain RI]SIO73826.1 conserved Plasmodium protein, unknown function [Babesia microti strain RI]|eukprot:XP_021337882.1 conserved Plasmodium protein, unknown function [Babesia microti strain RI]